MRLRMAATSGYVTPTLMVPAVTPCPDTCAPAGRTDASATTAVREMESAATAAMDLRMMAFPHEACCSYRFVPPGDVGRRRRGWPQDIRVECENWRAPFVACVSTVIAGPRKCTTTRALAAAKSARCRLAPGGTAPWVSRPAARRPHARRAATVTSEYAESASPKCWVLREPAPGPRPPPR